MPRPPFSGALGQTIHETVCNECWRAWVGEQTKIINEMRLKLGDPKAREILDADHYGLAKVKRRILEYLAVRKLNAAGRSPILCFVGPPGVGKTSLGQSIARALGLKFVRAML